MYFLTAWGWVGDVIEVDRPVEGLGPHRLLCNDRGNCGLWLPLIATYPAAVRHNLSMAQSTAAWLQTRTDTTIFLVLNAVYLHFGHTFIHVNDYKKKRFL